MFEWELVLAQYPPAHAALRQLRDGQVALFRAGDLHFGLPHVPAYDDARTMHRSRFSVIVEINRLIRDPSITCALFSELDARDPVLARTYAHQVLPDLVAGDQIALADRYRGDPLQCVEECNALARTFPLLPAARQAPRLAAMLMGLLRDVHIAIAVLRGLDQPETALALRRALLAGLQDPAMRALAQRDLDAPGAISRELVDHQMALEAMERPDDAPSGATPPDQFL